MTNPTLCFLCLMCLLWHLLWCTKKGSESKQVGKDARGRYLWTSTWTSHDHWLSVVTHCLKTDDIVAALETRERMIEWVSSQSRRHTSVIIDDAYISQYV